MKKSYFDILPATALLISLIFSSCHHKDLDFEEIPMEEVEIRFDWSNAPEANPASMATWFFYNPTESPDSTLRFDFPNASGGIVRIPYGHFSGLAYNSDNTDWAYFRNSENMEGFEIYTRQVNSLPKSGLSTRGIPRAKEAEDEVMVETPGQVWSAKNETMNFKRGERNKVLVFTPEDIMCHYVVDILDIENLSAIEGTAADASLSGMSGGYYQGKKQATDTKYTLPFIMTKDDSNNSLHGEFLTFGESPVRNNPHKLCLYALMKDGNKYFYTFDVARQIYDANDPKYVHIVVHGLSLPKPITGGNGFQPDVSDWEQIDIDLKM